ncbi:MAG: hypothetical protein AAGA21_18610 [Pseudomonadota bacterium]
MPETGDKVVQMTAVRDRLRLAFLGWQCRLRQLAVREDEARPSAGMRPRLSVAGQDAGPITVVITPLEPAASTDELRHIVRRTHDPRERYQAALRYLQSSHFQDPSQFDDRLTAIFGNEAELPKKLLGRSDCVLAFEQFSQRYWLTCHAELLDSKSQEFQATYWHNALFNATLPADVQIISFQPDWGQTRAEPSPI